MLNAIWLDTFVTLCELGHFTRTADRLGMTQPGVSQHLRKLEDQIGRPLILRDGKSFTLTPAGESVLRLGTDRRNQERALQDIIDADDPNAGQIFIGCSGSFAMCLYPALLTKMQVAPDLVVHLKAAPQDSILSAVLSGDMDVGIVTQKPNHPRLHATLLIEEELCLVLPANVPDRDLSLAALDDLGFVAHPDGPAYADELFSLNFPDNYKGADRLRIRTFVNQIGQILLPVAEGLGYTILPKSGVDSFPRPHDIKTVPLPKKRHHTLWLITQKNRAQFARVAAVMQLINGVAQSLRQA
nr:LysR family transcriptional regulator [Amylibacter sp.]